jgi:predicted nucleotidyltransferase
MLKTSSDSVVIRLPDRETLIRRLKIITDQILEDFQEIEEVILFGSLARGDYGTYSDADVFIVLSDSPHKRFFDRIPKYTFAFISYDMPVEVFPYTRIEIGKMVENGNLFITNALREGISLSKRT